MNKKLYIQMFSLHGLIRYENPELGRDADTGGQIKYVLDFSEELSKHDDIKKVDLFTKLIVDKTVSEDYSVPIEVVSDKFRIIRIPCGRPKYIRKELLWPHLDQFIDGTIKFTKKDGLTPDIIHSHYADAGYVGKQLAKFYSIPFVFTGHSLGLPKKEKLVAEGMKTEDIDRLYKIEHRVLIEEDILKSTDLVNTSTKQEIEQQYGMYKNGKLPRYFINPPGIIVEKFYPFYYEKLSNVVVEERSLQAKSQLLDQLSKFLTKPEKPQILSICRPDKKKNIAGLVKAYGEDKELQAMANLTIFAGIRKDISLMRDNERDVLTEMLLLMDKYDLYGKMAIPKRHDTKYEVPELYRIAAEGHGVFVNIALTEPFGLTLIEASACGLPIVATNDGGPRDIIKKCNNGIFLDPTDTKEVSSAIRSIIADDTKWQKFSSNGVNGVQEHYVWSKHVDIYINEIKNLGVKLLPEAIIRSNDNPIGDRLIGLKNFVFSDIDNTLVGDKESLEELIKIVSKNKQKWGFGVATGRPILSVIDILNENNIPIPEIIISSVGAEIYYQGSIFQDRGWANHISYKWDRRKISNVLSNLGFLELQSHDNQREFNISFNMEPEKDRIAQVHELLVNNGCNYNLIYSHSKYLDILPFRASKGKAIKYLSYKWEISLENIVVCGDSGNDEEMLRGNSFAVIVGNYSEELEKLRGIKNIYFSKQKYAKGIVDGLRHYKFIK